MAWLPMTVDTLAIIHRFRRCRAGSACCPFPLGEHFGDRACISRDGNPDASCRRTLFSTALARRLPITASPSRESMRPVLPCEHRPKPPSINGGGTPPLPAEVAVSQLPLFSEGPWTVLDDASGRIVYDERFLPFAQADAWFRELLRQQRRVM